MLTRTSRAHDDLARLAADGTGQGRRSGWREAARAFEAQGRKSGDLNRRGDCSTTRMWPSIPITSNRPCVSFRWEGAIGFFAGPSWVPERLALFIASCRRAGYTTSIPTTFWSMCSSAWGSIPHPRSNSSRRACGSPCSPKIRCAPNYTRSTAAAHVNNAAELPVTQQADFASRPGHREAPIPPLYPEPITVTS